MARASHEPKLRRVSLRIRFFETIHGMGTSTFETKLEVMRRTISIVAVLALFCAGRIFSPVAAEGAERPTLFPKLHAGQTFTYLIEYRTQKNVKILHFRNALFTRRTCLIRFKRRRGQRKC